MKYNYFHFIAALFLLGCANTKSISDSHNTRIFSANSLEVNKAIINYLTDEGWQIDTLDMKSGLIKTNLRRILFNGAEPRTRLSFRLQTLSNIQTRVEINVFHLVPLSTGARKKSGVAIVGAKEQKMDETDALECYEPIFKKIEEYLKH